MIGISKARDIFFREIDTVENFAVDYGIPKEHLEGALWARAIVTKRYWKKNLLPYFYKWWYEQNTSQKIKINLC